MRVVLERSKEVVKRLIWGESFKIQLKIKVILSDEEKLLAQRLNLNPGVVSLLDVQRYFESEEAFKVIQIEPRESFLDLRNNDYTFYIVGSSYLGNLQKLETAILKELEYNINLLRTLNEWEGTTTVEL